MLLAPFLVLWLSCAEGREEMMPSEKQEQKIGQG